VTDGQLRILQLNAGSLLEPWWDQRRDEIVAWVRELQPDIACFQEVWQSATSPNTVGWIADALGDGRHWTFGGGPLDPSLGREESLRFGSAVLSRWPIESTEYVALPLADAGPDDYVRKSPWELLHVRTAGLDVFSTHLAPAPTDGNHRRLQVLAIDDHVRRVRGDVDAVVVGRRRSAMPAILCGDFNAEPDSDEIRFLCGLTMLDGRTTFWQDAWAVAGDGGPGHTQDWRDNPIAAFLNVHRKRIDYVFVGDPFLREGGAGRVLSAQVVLDAPKTGVVASDHRGLVVDIVWPQRASIAP
jgi:endonuclease/exonuclease/phosphatase family metal-dependent hydrolase